MFSIQEVSELGRILELKETEVTFGRGPFLGVTDKRVSRHHGTLKQVGNGIEIKSIHVNPCFYARKSDPEKWLKLDKNETTILKQGDVFSLLPKSHIYKVLGENFTGKNGGKVAEKEYESENNVIQKKDDKKYEKLVKLPQNNKNRGSLEADKEAKIDNNSSVDDSPHKKHSKNLSTAEIINSARENQEKMGSLSPKKEHPVKATPAVTTPIKVNPKKHTAPIRSGSSNTFMAGEKEIAFPVERKRKLPGWMISVDKKAQKEPKTPIKTPKKTTKSIPKTSTAKKNRQNIKAMHFESDSDEIEEEILEKTKTRATSKNLTDNKKVETIKADGDSTAEQTSRQKETSTIEQDDSSNNTTEKKQHLSKNTAVEDADITSEDVEMVDASVLAQTTTEKTQSSKDQTTTSKNDGQSNSQRSDINAAASDDDQQTSSSSRASCAYGSSCYRKNPIHLQAFSHPGDPDYVDPGGSDDDDDSNRPECPYGRSCYRKHPLHKKQFKHTRRVTPKRVAKMRAQHRQDGESSSEDSVINDDHSEDDVDEGASDEGDEDWNPLQGSQSQKTTRKSARNRRRKRKSYHESDSDSTTDDEDVDDLVADAKDFARNKKLWKK